MRTALLVLVALFAIGVFSQESCPRCAPLCQNGDGTPKLCGDDGCGGSCGTCPFGQSCCRGGCVCQPNCAGRECGDDGCGYQSCGSCSSTQTCSNGICVGTAVAECAGRQCGTNRAGGSCGSCPAGQRCRGGQCECFYDCEERNCGNALQDEGANTGLCPPLSCGTCPTGFTCGATGMCSQSEQCIPDVEVVDCISRTRISTSATISISWTAQVSYSASLQVPAGQVASWETPGQGAFTFSISASGYLSKTENVTVNPNTFLITVCVDPAQVLVDVRAEGGSTSLGFPVSISFTGQGQGTIAWAGGSQQLWTHEGFGTYSFTAVPSTTEYSTGNLTETITIQTTIIIIYLPLGAFCGDGTCSNGEDYDFCPQDCLALVLEMEDAEGFGPVNDASISYYGNRNPRTPDQATGPNRNSQQADKTRVAVPGSNIISELTYTKGLDIYFETTVTNFINFYWVANSSDSRAVSEDGIYKLRVHLSALLQSNNKNYRFVNTWKPIDAPPLPYGPTDLNLHLFHPSGALDINTKTLNQDGFEIGNAVADSKQSGGPATMDISPGAGQMLAVWNSKPPRSSAITSSQNNRYIIHSGSYIVIYGKTSNAAQGKQLGQLVLNEYLAENAAAAADTVSDLWYAGQMTVRQSGVNQPEIVAIKRLKQATIESNRDMVFDCEAYTYCAQYRVPYSDSGKRDE